MKKTQKNTISLPKKTEMRKNILRNHKQKSSTRAVILVDIQDEEIRKFLKESASFIEVFFVDEIEENELLGVDAFIIDTENITTLKKYIQQGIAPIVFDSNENAEIFKDFDPMKFTGNAFLYKQKNKYAIFSQVCRFLENIRYPWDRKMLIKQLLETEI